MNFDEGDTVVSLFLYLSLGHVHVRTCGLRGWPSRSISRNNPCDLRPGCLFPPRPLRAAPLATAENEIGTRDPAAPLSFESSRKNPPPRFRPGMCFSFPFLLSIFFFFLRIKSSKPLGQGSGLLWHRERFMATRYCKVVRKRKEERDEIARKRPKKWARRASARVPSLPCSLFVLSFFLWFFLLFFSLYVL